MKSSKDIEPRVGMQVHFIGADIAIDVVRSNGGRFEGTVLRNIHNNHDRWIGGMGAWNDGHYDITWTPPTDEERRLFMEAGENQRRIDGGGHVCDAACHWAVDAYFGETRDAVFDSLALDGADYDNMPPGYKWHPPERSKR